MKIYSDNAQDECFRYLCNIHELFYIYYYKFYMSLNLINVNTKSSIDRSVITVIFIRLSLNKYGFCFNYYYSTIKL
jgi:hypothetical protein